MASLLELDDNDTNSLYGSFTPYEYAPYDDYKGEIPNPDRGVGDLIQNDSCVNFETTQKAIIDREKNLKEEINIIINNEFNKFDKDENDFPLNYNENIFDIYRYENKYTKYPQNIEYISTEEKALLQKYIPTIYIENDDKSKFINPNYYLEFTKVLFENKIIGQQIKSENKYYLCYFMFYESKRNISETFSQLSSSAMRAYEGKLFKTSMIVLELNTENLIESIFLSSNLDDNNEYKWIKPLNNKSEKINIFISKDKHNIYLLNNPIESYSEFISYRDEKCENPIETLPTLEPICKSNIYNTRNADLLRYRQIEDMDNFLYNKQVNNIGELKWYKATSIWLPRYEADLLKKEQSKNMSTFIRNKELKNSNDLQLHRIKKKFKFIPDWIYKIIPKFFGFMYISEYLVYTYEYLL